MFNLSKTIDFFCKYPDSWAISFPYSNHEDFQEKIIDIFRAKYSDIEISRSLSIFNSIFFNEKNLNDGILCIPTKAINLNLHYRLTGIVIIPMYAVKTVTFKDTEITTAFNLQYNFRDYNLQLVLKPSSYFYESYDQDQPKEKNNIIWIVI